MKFHSCLLSVHSIPRQSEPPQPARLKVTRRSGKKQLGNSGAGSTSLRDPAVWEDQRCPAHHGLPASPSVPQTQHPSAPHGWGAVLIQQTAPGSCCHWQGRQGWTSALVPQRAGAAQWASVRVVSLLQGMECPDRFGALEEQWVPALGLMRGSSKSPLGIHHSKDGL